MLESSVQLRTLTVEGRPRSYLLYVPPSAAGGRPPVVIAFHGAGTNAEAMRAFCGLDEKASENGFVLVYPSGTGRRDDLLTWNAGNCCGYAERQRVDDVAYVNALMDDLATVVAYDENRVFAAGMSNGAMMCYRLAAELSQRIAAIAAVAGPMAIDPVAPSRPVPIIHFHGSEDEFAPLAGGIGLKSLYRASKFSVDSTIRAWVNVNGCPPRPQVTQLADLAGDGTTVTVSRFAPGRNHSEVLLYLIAGMGHTWPGRQPTLNYLGPWTQNIIANDLIWEFFARHPKPAA